MAFLALAVVAVSSNVVETDDNMMERLTSELEEGDKMLSALHESNPDTSSVSVDAEIKTDNTLAKKMSHEHKKVSVKEDCAPGDVAVDVNSRKVCHFCVTCVSCQFIATTLTRSLCQRFTMRSISITM